VEAYNHLTCIYCRLGVKHYRHLRCALSIRVATVPGFASPLFTYFKITLRPTKQPRSRQEASIRPLISPRRRGKARDAVREKKREMAERDRVRQQEIAREEEREAVRERERQLEAEHEARKDLILLRERDAEEERERIMKQDTETEELLKRAREEMEAKSLARREAATAAAADATTPTDSSLGQVPVRDMVSEVKKRLQGLEANYAIWRADANELASTSSKAKKDMASAFLDVTRQRHNQWSRRTAIVFSRHCQSVA
ncbi:hypothetical protein FRB90_002431, partial [Tulasnella sp. 427]